MNLQLIEHQANVAAQEGSFAGEGILKAIRAIHEAGHSVIAENVEPGSVAFTRIEPKSWTIYVPEASEGLGLITSQAGYIAEQYCFSGGIDWWNLARVPDMPESPPAMKRFLPGEKEFCEAVARPDEQAWLADGMDRFNTSYLAVRSFIESYFASRTGRASLYFTANELLHRSVLSGPQIAHILNSVGGFYE